VARHSPFVLVLRLSLSGWQRLEAWDAALFGLINSQLHSALLDPLMLFLSDRWSLILPLAGLLIYRTATADKRMQDWLRAGFVLLVIGVTDASATVLKEIVCRPRPCHVLTDVHLRVDCSESFSFPSNHAANIFALAALFIAYDRKRSVLWVSIAALVAYSRVYLGVHYPLDVVAGAALGASIGWGSLALARRVAGLRDRVRTQAGE
jgi:undecaprenyl-diphosphatase